MEIIGFIALFILMMYISATAALIALNNLGTWNIVGVKNKISTKIMTLLFIILTIYAWYLLFSLAPFDISMKH